MIRMKKYLSLVLLGLVVIFSSRSKEKVSEQFTLLTDHVWTSDSLLANGVDASGQGQVLEFFKGDAIFNEDGTGTFGQYSGNWLFADNETSLAITSPDLPFALSTHIEELTALSLKVSFVYPGVTTVSIRMTFKPK